MMIPKVGIGASSDKVSDWQAIDWPKVRHQVRRLQLRIAKAIRVPMHRDSPTRTQPSYWR
jgi:hypothetical protein